MGHSHQQRDGGQQVNPAANHQSVLHPSSQREIKQKTGYEASNTIWESSTADNEKTEPMECLQKIGKQCRRF
jgi:hypothetical protein